MKSRILIAATLLAGWPVGRCDDIPAPTIYTYPGTLPTVVVEWQDNRSGLYANYLQTSPDLVHWYCAQQVVSVPDSSSITGFQANASALFFRIHSVDITNGSSDMVDSDGDGIPNGTETANGTDPYDPDTDHDGIPDCEDDYPTTTNFVQMYSSDTLTVWTPRG
ncbi:MAG: hypothetical protein WCS43_16955 [Verrucomicrobiota bacterium]